MHYLKLISLNRKVTNMGVGNAYIAIEKFNILVVAISALQPYLHYVMIHWPNLFKGTLLNKRLVNFRKIQRYANCVTISKYRKSRML